MEQEQKVLAELIEACWQGKQAWNDAVRNAVDRALQGMEEGVWRVAEPMEGGASTENVRGAWRVNEWLKAAILLYFRHMMNVELQSGDLSFYDKVPVRHFGEKEKVRVVPPAVVRRGAHVAAGAVLMPSYVNIGAFVGEGTLVDTWATVGSCAQVGRGVHVSGGVGLGGVLEPMQARPVIVEDGAFLGSRCIVVEGAHVGKEAVLGANVVITSSTYIIDVTGEEPVEYRGWVPPRAVVIPGVRSRQWPAGEYGVPCALIIGHRKESTDQKTTLNDALRQFNVPV